jgi:hypothetical protein
MKKVSMWARRGVVAGRSQRSCSCPRLRRREAGRSDRRDKVTAACGGAVQQFAHTSAAAAKGYYKDPASTSR